MEYNTGRLKDKIIPQQNIVYYRKGQEEISINVTNNCPNNCCFCIRDINAGWNVSNLYLIRDPSLDEITKEIGRAIDLNDKIKIKKFKICGYGEPLLRVDILPQMVSFIKKKSPDSAIQLTTTGWPLYHVKRGEDYFNKAVHNSLNEIYLSLHATNSLDYKRIVNPNIDSKLAFDQVKKFISLSKKLNVLVTLAFLDRESLSREEVEQFANKFECNYHIRRFEK